MQAKLKPLQPQVLKISNPVILIFYCLLDVVQASISNWKITHTVSYLFPLSRGVLFGLSVGSTLIQEILRSTLHKRLSGANVDKVFLEFYYF